jgi:hypothetical protein
VDERGATLYTDKPLPGAVLVSTGSQRPPEVAQRNYAANQAATNANLNASNQRIADSQDNSRLAANVAKDLEASRAALCKQARESYDKSISSHGPATVSRYAHVDRRPAGRDDGERLRLPARPPRASWRYPRPVHRQQPHLRE